MFNDDKKNIYISIDFETGGWDEKKHTITEFGVAIIEDLKVIDSLGSLVKPYAEYDIKALEYSKIKEADLLNCAFGLSDMVETLIEICQVYNPKNSKYKKPYLVGHNINAFDLRFLKEAFVREGKNYEDYFGYVVFDTLELSHIVFYDNIKIDNKKLGTVCKFLDVELKKAHNAEDDAIACAEIFCKLTRYFSSKFDKSQISNLKVK